MPPYKTVEWSMRDNTNYMETGAPHRAADDLDVPRSILENFYKKSRNSVEAGRTEAPYAYVIPGDQPDMTRAAFVVNILRMQGIEVGRATAPITVKEGTFPAGSFIVKRDQPYGRLAKILLQKQEDPDPKLRTYDDSGWTMGLMAHVKVVASEDPKALHVAADPVDHFDPQGSIGDAGAPAYAVLDYGSVNLAKLRYQLKDTPIRIAEQAFKAGDRTVPAGSFIVDGAAYARLKAAVVPLGLTAVALDGQARGPHPRGGPAAGGGLLDLGLDPERGLGALRLRPVRHALRPDLQGRCEEGRAARALRRDHRAQPGPLGEGLRLRHPDALEAAVVREDRALQLSRRLRLFADIRGGLGLTGLEELRKFAADGGVLITLGELQRGSGRIRPDAGRGGQPAVQAPSTPPARSSMRRSYITKQVPSPPPTVFPAADNKKKCNTTPTIQKDTLPFSTDHQPQATSSLQYTPASAPHRLHRNKANVSTSSTAITNNPTHPFVLQPSIAAPASPRRSL